MICIILTSGSVVSMLWHPILCIFSHSTSRALAMVYFHRPSSCARTDVRTCPSRRSRTESGQSARKYTYWLCALCIFSELYFKCDGHVSPNILTTTHHLHHTHHTPHSTHSGGGKKSHEKLLVVTYAMKAMGLHRLAETAAALLKRNTGLVAQFGDGSGAGGGCSASGIKSEGGDVKKEGEVKVEGGVSADIKMEVVDGSVSSSGAASSSSNDIKTEPTTDATATTTTTTTTPSPSPRGRGKRTRGQSTISRAVSINGATAIVYSGDGSGCVASGSPVRIKLEPLSPVVNYTRTRARGNNKNIAVGDDQEEPASVRKKRQKIQEIMEKIRMEEAAGVEGSYEHVVAVAV